MHIYAKFLTQNWIAPICQKFFHGGTQSRKSKVESRSKNFNNFLKKL